jgi:hypothetical protein
MQKSVLNIKLSEMPSMSNSQGEQKPNSRGLNHMAKRIFIVNAMALLESLCNEARFIALDRAIGVSFNFEHPFRINNVDLGWRRNKCPCVIAEESLILLLHCITPLRNTKCVMVICRLKRPITHTMSLASS